MAMSRPERRQQIRVMSSIITAGLLFVSLVAVSGIAAFVSRTRDWSIPTALGLATFLIMLNGQLNGASKEKIDALLSVVILILLGLAVFQYGWLTAGGYVVACIMFGALVSKFVVPLARLMTGR